MINLFWVYARKDELRTRRQRERHKLSSIVYLCNTGNFSKAMTLLKSNGIAQENEQNFEKLKSKFVKNNDTIFFFEP